MKSFSFSVKLSLFLAILKTALIEGGFALNFLTFSYHQLLGGRGSLLITASIIIQLIIMLAFYTSIFQLLVILKYKSTSRREYFFLAILFTFIELATWNLPSIKVSDLTSILALTSINIFVFFIGLATLSDYTNS